MAKSLQGQTNRKFKYLKALRKFGFRARMATVGGRRVLSNRRNKGRHVLASGDRFGTAKLKAVRSPRRR